MISNDQKLILYVFGQDGMVLYVSLHMIARFTPKYSIPVVEKEGSILLQDMYKSSNILSAHPYNIFSVALYCKYHPE